MTSVRLLLPVVSLRRWHCSCLALVSLDGVDTSFGHGLPDLVHLPVRSCARVLVRKLTAALHLVLVHHHAESNMLFTLFHKLVPVGWVPWLAKQTLATDSKRVSFEAFPQATVAHVSQELATPVLGALS